MTDRTARERLEELRSAFSSEQRRALERFEARCGKFGERERRFNAEVELRETTNAREYVFAVKGHAIVYGRKSLDLGGFQEIIADKAAAPVLDRAPHVILVRDHQLGTELLSTRSPNALLELREDPKGVHFYGKVPDLGDLTDRTYKQMKAGLVSQASFAFTVARDRWEIINEGKPDEQIVRTIEELEDLFDVTITSQGAYPQTDSSVIRAYAFAYAETTGSLPERTEGAEPQEAAADTDADVEERTVPDVEADGEPSGSEGEPVGSNGTDGTSERGRRRQEWLLDARHSLDKHRLRNTRNEQQN